ncbi:hypothetical protein P9112_000905 [Eukaryota sp. TZLM1-RC]
MDFDLGEDLVISEIHAAEEKDPTKRAIVILIDGSSNMFRTPTKSEDGSPTLLPIVVALHTVRQFIRTAVFESDSDEFSLLFYHTESSDNEYKIPNIQSRFPFSLPSADLIRSIESLIGDLESSSNPNDVLPSSPSFDHLNMFSVALQILSSKPMTTWNRFLYIMTNSTPSISDHQSEIELCRQRLKDLFSSNIDLFFFPVSPLSLDDFCSSSFWRMITELTTNELESITIEPDLEQDVVKRRGTKRRALNTLDFNVSDELSFKIQTFSLLHQSKPPNPVQLHRETNQLLQTRTTYLNELGEELTKDDITKYVTFLDGAVKMTDDDVSSIKGLVDPGLALLGFKNLSTLGLEANVRPSSLVRPAPGSEEIFSTLYKTMKLKGVYALCRYTASRISLPYLVALLPSAADREGVNAEASRLLGVEGLWMVKLPYREDYRDLFDKLGETGGEEVLSRTEAAQNLIDGLMIDYNPADFLNPQLQLLYSYIESRALRKPFDSDSINDETLVKDEVFVKYASDISALIAAPSRSKKVVSNQSNDDVIDDDVMKSRVENDDWTGVLVKQLKAFLKEKNVKGLTGLKKADLIEKVKEILE